MNDESDQVLFAHGEGDGPVAPGTFGFSRRAFLAGGGALAMSLWRSEGADAATSTAKKTKKTVAKAVPTTTAKPATAPSTTVATTKAAPSTPGARPEAKTTTLTIGVPSLQEAYVDPHFAVGGLVFPLRWAISEFLYAQDQGGNFVPNLATGYTLSPDKLAWTFKLRSGVKMHDGSDFTAADVKTAVDRILAGADFTHLATFKSYVTGASVVDPLTVKITTNRPYATLVSDSPPPIPTGYYNKVGDAAFRKNPMSCGAWKFVSQELNANVKYERFEEYFDPKRKPNWKKLVYAIVPDESSRVAGIKTGALDIAYGITANTAAGLDKQEGVSIAEIPNTGIGYCMMLDNYTPGSNSPLTNIDVRRALLMAIDREAIAKAIYKGYARVATSNVPLIMLGFNKKAQAVPYYPDEAKKLLAKAGFPSFTVDLNLYSSTPTLPDIQKLAEAIAAYWGQVGVTVKLNVADSATILPQWRNKTLKGAGIIAGPMFFYDEPSRLASSFFSSKAAYSTVTSSKQLDDLVNEINEEMDQGGRAILGRQLQELLDTNLWGLPLVTVSSLVALGPNVAKFESMESNSYAGPLYWVVAK